MYSRYENPLTARYASAEMSELWSAQRKHSTWRQLWVWLAEAEAELGLPVTREQIAELKASRPDLAADVNFDGTFTVCGAPRDVGSADDLMEREVV